MVNGFYLLVVEREPGVYRLYVGKDGRRYCHYDTGIFRSPDEAMKKARLGFAPRPFIAFPYAPFARETVLAEAPHAFDLLGRGEGRDQQ